MKIYTPQINQINLSCKLWFWKQTIIVIALKSIELANHQNVTKHSNAIIIKQFFFSFANVCHQIHNLKVDRVNWEFDGCKWSFYLFHNVSPSKAAFATIESPIDAVHFSNTIPLFRNFMKSYHICSSIQINNMEWIILGKYCFQQGNVSISNQDSSNNKFNLKSCGCRWTCKELNPKSMKKDEEHRNV